MSAPDEFSTNEISDWFWNLIEQSERSIVQLEELLNAMSKEEIVRFHREFEHAAVQLTDPPFIDYMTYQSDDDIEDVADWIVSQGKDYYTHIWNNPASTPRELDDAEATSLAGVASNVFWRRFREAIPDPDE